MIPVMIEQFWEIWLEAQKEAEGEEYCPGLPAALERCQDLELFNFTRECRGYRQEQLDVSKASGRSVR
jgi:hypothetical protein